MTRILKLKLLQRKPRKRESLLLKADPSDADNVNDETKIDDAEVIKQSNVEGEIVTAEKPQVEDISGRTGETTF